MRIAFYAPLKSPDHPTPSGDRQMARLLIRALTDGGAAVEVVSHFRVYLPAPSESQWEACKRQAELEVARIAETWTSGRVPDLWFCYHPYYKSPDLLGPALVRRFSVPYVTAEASYAERRNDGIWRECQDRVANAAALAATNFCLTRRDRDGLAAAVPSARLRMLPPFIDCAPFRDAASQETSARLVTVAMMRKGDKFESYRMLAQALDLLTDLDWRWSAVGDGEMRDEVQALFEKLPPHRIEWLGALPPKRVAGVLKRGGIYVWPGYAEAYGLAYLEAQAAGLPVVAQATAGVPDVVKDRETGLLTPPGDVGAFAAAIRSLIENHDLRIKMAGAARRNVFEFHSLTSAAKILRSSLAENLP
jgi:glycosyltransferase involved in cell wall biosynthesis